MPRLIPSTSMTWKNALKGARYRCGPIGMCAYLVYRFGDTTLYEPHSTLSRKLRWAAYRVLDVLVVRIMAHAQLPAQARSGARLGLAHDANGIILSQGVVIGDDCTIFQQVTIGTINGDLRSPVIGDRVFIGAGAKILGPVTIGNDAMIGANAVVIRDVADGATAVGVPARVILPGERREDRPHPATRVMSL